MPITRIAMLGLGCLGLAACASRPPLQDTSLCDRMDDWAHSLTPGQSSKVRLVRGGTWMVDHYKTCEHTEGDAAAGKFCVWLMDNSSTEYMEANINAAMSCLQGQRIKGYMGGTGLEAWSGHARFYSPRLTADAKVTVDYSVRYFDDDGEDFIQFLVEAD